MYRTFIITVSFLIVLAGCGGQNYDYQDSNDIKPGPGLLSGEDGKFDLIQSDKDNSKETKDKEESKD